MTADARRWRLAPGFFVVAQANGMYRIGNVRDPFRCVDTDASLVGVIARLAEDRALADAVAGLDEAARGSVEKWLEALAAAGLLVEAGPAALQVDDGTAPRLSTFEVVRASDLVPDLEAMEPTFLESWDEAVPLTVTSVCMGYALWNACTHVARERLPGDYVECGVWRGGSTLLAWRAFEASGDTGRSLYLYDTFDLSWEPPSVEDGIVLLPNALALPAPATHNDTPGQRAAPDLTVERRGTSVESVRAVLVGAGCSSDRLVFAEGLVQTTLRTVVPEAISVLRLDTDLYESTLAELTVLYPKLVPGGVLIIDDYGKLAGATRATDEYFSSFERRPLLHRIEAQGRIGVKLS